VAKQACPISSITINKQLITKEEEEEERQMRISLPDSLHVFASPPPPPPPRHLHCSESLPWTSKAAAAAAIMKHRLFCSSSTSGPVPLSHPNLPEERPCSNRSR